MLNRQHWCVCDISKHQHRFGWMHVKDRENFGDRYQWSDYISKREEEREREWKIK